MSDEVKGRDNFLVCVKPGPVVLVVYYSPLSD